MRTTRTRNALIATLLTGVFAVGFVGQGQWRIGARPASVAVSAAAVEVVGGAGTRQPVRAVAQVAVTNQGSDTIRLDDAVASRASAVPTGLDPRELRIEPEHVGNVNVTLLLDCRSTAPFELPTLQIVLPDGARRSLPIAGAGRLVEACSRSGPTTRPLTFTKPIEDDAGLALSLASPTTRRIRVLAVRAGGVRLGAAGLPLTIGAEPVSLRLTAPPACSRAWLTAGIPGSLTLDTDDGTGDGTGDIRTANPATLQLKAGPVLTDWLLDTACVTTTNGTGS